MVSGHPHPRTRAPTPRIGGVRSEAREGRERLSSRGRVSYGVGSMAGQPTTIERESQRDAVGGRWEGSPDPERARERRELATGEAGGAGTHLGQHRPPRPDHPLRRGAAVTLGSLPVLFFIFGTTPIFVRLVPGCQAVVDGRGQTAGGLDVGAGGSGGWGGVENRCLGGCRRRTCRCCGEGGMALLRGRDRWWREMNLK